MSCHAVMSMSLSILSLVITLTTTGRVLSCPITLSCPSHCHSTAWQCHAPDWMMTVKKTEVAC